MKSRNIIKIAELALSIGRVLFKFNKEKSELSHAKKMSSTTRKNRRREEDDKLYRKLMERVIIAKLKHRPINNTSKTAIVNVSTAKESKLNLDELKLVPASDIPDRKIDSPLLGHSGGLIVLNGEGGGGKTAFALTFMAEACSGKSSDLIPNAMFVTGPKYQGIYYHAERDNNFHTNYAALLEPLPNLKALYDMESIEDYTEALRMIEHHVLEVNDNVITCIDNITAVLPDLMKNHKVSDFINGLKRIRKKVECRGYTATFIIVTHSNSKGISSGSKDWFNLADSAFINISVDTESYNDSYRIIDCTKRKGLPPFCIKAEIIASPYLHLAARMPPSISSAQNVYSPNTPQPPTLVSLSTSRKVVTLEVATMFYVEKKHNGLSWNQIYTAHRYEYELANRDTVRNKVMAIPSMISKKLTEEDLIDIWGMKEVNGKSAEEILNEVGAKYKIHKKDTIQYIIDNAPALTSGNLSSITF